MIKGLLSAVVLGVTLVGTGATAQAALPVTYDIVYVKQPRNGDNEHIIWPEAFHPGRIEPNSDLMLLHPDGSEEVLVDTEHGAVTDPFISFDGQWVYYSLFHDVRPESLNFQRGYLPRSGADIFRINLASRQIEQLTFQEFTPNTGTGNWDTSNPVNPASGFNRLGYGILNTGPAPIAGGKIIFTSNRNGYRPTKGYTFPSMQLFVMDANGDNVTPIAPMTLGSALHPTQMVDGRILFSSYESQGLRDQRLWGVWSIWPDGRNWAPVVSAFKHARVFHFLTQLSDQSVVVEDYYNLNNFGFGALYRIPADSGANGPAFHSAFLSENPEIRSDNAYGYFRMPFTPKGMFSITPLSTSDDNAATDGSGKYTHPSAAPNNDLLVAWSDGPVNKLNRPTPWPAVDSGIYMIPGGEPIENMAELVLLKNDPNYNEVWPRAVVNYRDIYGVDEPATLPWLPNDGSEHPLLPEGTPYGLVGTSSFYKRESFPGVIKGADNFDGLDAFNTTENNRNSNWNTQGADAGLYQNSDIWAVRIVSMEPNPDRGYGPHSSPSGGVFYKNAANERLRILGEIPLRKFDKDGNPILDPEGNPDTSFLAKIPADTPFTFQTIDRNGMALNISQTWHQVRPGEVRHDCGGCHAHSQEPLAFSETAAAKPDYSIWDLTQDTPLVSQNQQGEPTLRTESGPVVNVEFFKDIRPVLQEKCITCHTQNAENPPANLVLDDLTMYDGLPGDYKRLCDDRGADWGVPPLVTVGGNPVWRQTNASRYIRHFQSRRSLLMWKLFGERLDGWTNEDHPTAAIPGDASSLPEGASINASDLDFVGSMMPVPGTGVEPLTADQKMAFARWIDLGCPIDRAHQTDHDGFGWFSDDIRPTLAVSSPRAGILEQPFTEIRIGLADAYTGINMSSLSVKADISIDGHAPGTELRDRFVMENDGVWVYSLPKPVSSSGKVTVSVQDNQGNDTTVVRSFSIGAVAPVMFDQNGDGKADVVWRDSSSGNNWFYAMNGHQVEASQPIEQVNTDWVMAGRGDFDGDGKSDLLWRNFQTGENYLSVMDGNQRLSGQLINVVATGAGWSVAAVADFDGDAKADILWRNANTGVLWMYLMDAEKITANASVTTISDLAWQVVDSPDLNGDGRADLLLRHETTGLVWTYLMNGATVETSRQLMTAGLSWQLLTSGDFDGDNDDDILWRNTVDGRNYIYLLDNGVVNWQARGLISQFSDQDWQAVMTADFDGDGDDDIFWRHASGGQNYMYLMNGLAYQGRAVNTVTDPNWKVVK